MLTRVPFRFCSIAIILAMPTVPSAADLVQPSVVSGKVVRIAANPAHSAASRSIQKQAIELPLANDQGMKFVHNYIRNNDDVLSVVKRRSEGPFSIIDSVLDRYGLPEELKYLAVIESQLKPSALSRVGARGPWQLMPGTAHELGLKVNRRADDRVNYYKSTVAAAKYLRDLHREFGDWLLVLAAYNGGPRPVCRAIHQAHSRSFWVLQKYLPAESRGHVKKFIATAYYFEETAAASHPAVRTGVGVGVGAAAVGAAAKSQGVIAGAVVAASETDNDRFQRLMKESAQSLKASNELVGN